jgi:ABC-type phosphate/phosphonate transport system substrate-binding protein
MTLVLGAVAYDPKVVTIWDGFRTWLRRNDLPLDYVLYSNYESQVEDLVAGRIDVAWNSPLAWVRAARLARSAGRTVEAIVMRDTDRDLTSVVVAREDRPRTVAVGAIDSPQATLIPLSHLRSLGLDPVVRRFDVGVGLHGDHIGGERAAATALAKGEVDAACMIDANHLAFTKEGVLPPDGLRIIAQTPPYDHCNMTAIDTAPAELLARFASALRSMSYEDPEVRPLLDLEGLRVWVDGRTSGYAQLEAAVDETGFYDREGQVTAAEYAP